MRTSMSDKEAPFRGGWITCTKQYFGELPIRNIDFPDPAEEARHDEIAQMAEQMLALAADLQTEVAYSAPAFAMKTSPDSKWILAGAILAWAALAVMVRTTPARSSPPLAGQMWPARRHQ